MLQQDLKTEILLFKVREALFKILTAAETVVAIQFAAGVDFTPSVIFTISVSDLEWCSISVVVLKFLLPVPLFLGTGGFGYGTRLEAFIWSSKGSMEAA